VARLRAAEEAILKAGDYSKCGGPIVPQNTVEMIDMDSFCQPEYKAVPNLKWTQFGVEVMPEELRPEFGFPKAEDAMTEAQQKLFQQLGLGLDALFDEGFAANDEVDDERLLAEANATIQAEEEAEKSEREGLVAEEPENHGEMMDEVGATDQADMRRKP